MLSHTLSNRGTGNRQYSIAVLKRDAPEIAEEVINGTITAAEGMRRAGKRKLMVTHPATIDGYYNSIQKNLTPCQIRELIQLLTNESIIRI